MLVNMDASFDPDGNAFSSANFDSADAGSGSVTAVRSSIDTTLIHHMNIAAATVPDERDVLRPWRKRLRDTMATENEKLFEFLEKPIEDMPISMRHTQFMLGLNTASFSSSNSWMSNNINPVVDASGVLLDIDRELDAELCTIRTQLNKIMDMYTATVKTLFTHGDALHAKLTTIENLQKKLTELPIDGPPSAARSALQTSLLDYMHAMYSELSIATDYKELCKSYTRFHALRSVMLALHTSSTVAPGSDYGSPLCAICNADRVMSALIPCGHAFCNNCAQKQRSQCFVCRCQVRERQRVYFI